MKNKKDQLDNAQLNLDEALGIKIVTPEDEEVLEQPDRLNFQSHTHFNDVGEPISVENGYAPADVEGLEEDKDEDENAL